MSRFKIINAVDIGSTKITSLMCQYFPEEEQTNVLGVSSVEARGIRKGQIVDIEEATESVTKSVEAAERMAGFSLKEATIGISAPHINSINSSGVVAVSDPNKEITSQDVDRVIEGARAISIPSSSEIIHVVPRYFTVDGQEGILDPVGMTGVRLEVEANIVIASLPAIKNLTRCINDVGLNIISLTYSGFAAGETVLTETERELGVILIDIGGGVTSLTIYSEGFPCFVRVLPIGANNVTNDLAIGLRLSLENAEKLKNYLTKDISKQINKDKKTKKKTKEEDKIDLRKAGIVLEEKQKISRMSTVNGIIKPRLDEIFSLLKEEIKESGFGGATPAGVILTGGGAHVVGVKRSCQEVLGLPARIGIPKPVSGLVDEIIDPSYASCLGLISYMVKTKKETIKTQPFNLSHLAEKMKFGGLVKKLSQVIKPLLP